MVFFVCEGCNESMKKNQVDKHASRCRSCHAVTCVDCQVTFYGNDFVAHTVCVSEAEKYEKTLYKGPKVKANPQDAWMVTVLEAVENASKAPHPIQAHLKRLGDLNNIPRQQKKFNNFIKNSLRLHNDNLIDEMFKYLESFKPASVVPAPSATTAAATAAASSSSTTTATAETDTTDTNQLKEEKIKKKKKKSNDNGKDSIIEIEPVIDDEIVATTAAANDDDGDDDTHKDTQNDKKNKKKKKKRSRADDDDGNNEDDCTRPVSAKHIHPPSTDSDEIQTTTDEVTLKKKNKKKKKDRHDNEEI